MIDSFQELIIRTDHPKPVTMILLESIQSAVNDLLDVAENIEDSIEVLNVVRQLMATLVEVAKYG